MFHADITFVLALIALTAGAFLLLSAKIHKDTPAVTCKIVGFIVVILAIIVILFSGYGMLKSYAMKRKMMSHIMQQGKMTPCMMMKKKPGMQMRK